MSTNTSALVSGWKEANAEFQRFLIQDGLYRWLDLEGEHKGIFNQMIDNGIFVSFDLYCPHCKMVTTYQIKPASVSNRGTQTRYQTDPVKPNLIAFNAVCLRIQHTLTFVMHRTDKRLTKIGQFPSIADVSFGELNEIDRGLDLLDRKELGRAVGLFAHDAPLGAFVYLRRVFERMIERAHKRHVESGLPEIVDFSKMPMDQRIKELRDQLPAKVVQNSNVFGVLSKGIHELSDDEGRELFPLVKSVIFQMLGQEERLRQAREQEAATDAALARVIERYSTKDTESVLLDDQSPREG